MLVQGLTYPYLGDTPCSRLYMYGYTFRLVKGDRYIAVFKGTCVETRRYFIIHDHLANHRVLEGQQPVHAIIPVTWSDWADDWLLQREAEKWVRGGTRTA